MEEKMAKATTGDTAPAKTDKAKAPKSDNKQNVFARLAQYFRDVRSEMKRVVWPSRPEVINSSIVVGVTLAFFIVFTAIIDQVVVQVIRLLTNMG